eukprot:s29_g60.t1
MDSAREFVSEAFVKFLQSLNIQCEVVPPDAHWQCGRIERHGGVLQAMLSKYELEHDVSSYHKLQQALTQCIMAKNSCSLKHGYSPDTLVFGKGLRIPASITSDDSLPAHAIAESEDQAGLKFKELLAMREAARRAFHAADNDMALRRAALRRDRPHRGSYSEGEWVMVWKIHNFKGSWKGPARVIKQDSDTTVFCNNAGSLIKAAPEHIRPVSAVEARLIPLTMPSIPQIDDRRPLPNNHPHNPNTVSPEIPESRSLPNAPITIPEDNHNPPSNASEQPDPEGMPSTPHPSIMNNEISPSNNPPLENPELQPHEIPVPDDESDELLCDLLTCTDEADPIMPDGENLVWRAEFEFSRSQLDAMCQNQHEPTTEEFLFLATAGKRQRTEVKLSTLDPSERLEFEKAKAKEVLTCQLLFGLGKPVGLTLRDFRWLLGKQRLWRGRWEEKLPEAGGSKKAFTTSGVRRTLANAVNAGLPAHELDTLVTKWKHQGYRQDIHSEDDNAEIGVLDFASLLQEIALVRNKDEDPLEALVSLIELCDPGAE